MKMRVVQLYLCVILVLALTFSAVGQAVSAPAQLQAAATGATDPEMAQFSALMKQATDEITEFAKAGGKPLDANSPYVPLADKLWQFREKHRGTGAASEAAGAALALWTYGYQTDRARQMIAALPPQEKQNIGNLIDKNHLLISKITGDFDPLGNWGQIDPQWREINTIFSDAVSEINAFTKSARPAAEWKGMFSKHAAKFWQYGQEHPDRTQKAAGAPAAALAYWILAGERERADRLLASLPDTPKQIQRIISNLLTTARITGDYASVVSWEKHTLEQTDDKTRRAGLYLAIGRAYQLSGDKDSAQAALESALRESSDAHILQTAQKLKTSLSAVSDQLAVGRPAPDFRARTITGETVSLTELDRKVVVINVAATYCPLCLSEIPSLKKMYARDKDKGLVILSVMLDQELEPVQKMVARYKIPWPQILDGPNGPVAAHYQASGTPTYYVVAGGKVIGNSVPISQLPAIISGALEGKVQAGGL